MSALDDLKAEVAATITVEQSAVTLIQGIAAQLQAALAAAANPDPAIVDLTNQLTASASALAAAVAANPVPVPPASTAPGSTDTGSTDTGSTAPADDTSTDGTSGTTSETPPASGT
ncbi:hypothetical protein [Paraburkholderia sp. MM6662-R1]|uniref:hypothetical protein n=1 Tax=Paraburkholderia sp. MM6662-R1 TaxID=2991066 RepID=UPI003D1BD9B6